MIVINAEVKYEWSPEISRYSVYIRYHSNSVIGIFVIYIIRTHRRYVAP